MKAWNNNSWATCITLSNNAIVLDECLDILALKRQYTPSSLGFQAPNFFFSAVSVSPRRVEDWEGEMSRQANKGAVLVVSPQGAPSMPCFLVPIALFFCSSFEKRKWPYSLKRPTFGRVLKAVTSSTAPKIGIQEETQPEIRAWLKPFSLRQPEC